MNYKDIIWENASYLHFIHKDDREKLVNKITDLRMSLRTIFHHKLIYRKIGESVGYTDDEAEYNGKEYLEEIEEALIDFLDHLERSIRVGHISELYKS